MKKEDAENIKELFRVAQMAYVVVKSRLTTDRQRDVAADGLQAAILNAGPAIAEIRAGKPRPGNCPCLGMQKTRNANAELLNALETMVGLLNAHYPEFSLRFPRETRAAVATMARAKGAV